MMQSVDDIHIEEHRRKGIRACQHIKDDPRDVQQEDRVIDFAFIENALKILQQILTLNILQLVEVLHQRIIRAD